ncbi:MAG: TraB/GumN family protein [Prevotella sp.]|nr:TraB/GumN family protein [Prevotella sp.]
MRKLVFVVLLALSALSIQAQLLYRISGKDASGASYILGTYHFAPSSFCDSIPGLWDSFAQVKQVCGELVMSEMMNPENVMKLQKAMMLPEGKTIQTLLTDDEMKRLNAFTKEVLGMDFTGPLLSQLGSFTPGALYEQFIVMLYLRKTPNFNPNDGIDTYMQTKGLEKGYSVTGFESVDLQIKALFQSQSLERQKQVLMCLINNKEMMVDNTERLTAAYFKQNLEEIGKIVDEKRNDECDTTEEEEEVLIYGRNANWMSQMPQMLREKSTLFVVGAAHLIGEKGMLQLLRNAGYVVEPVTK